MKEITRDQLLEICAAQFDEPDVHPRHYAFVCPMCGTVQSPESLIRAGVPTADIDGVIGYDCVGRYTSAPSHNSKSKPGRGCDWTLGGFFRIHKLKVVSDEGVRRCFEIATPEQARELRALHQRNPGAITSRCENPNLINK
jgi:hypothetical protein